MGESQSNLADSSFLDTFPAWLRTLGADAEQLADLLGEEGLTIEARQAIAGGLIYLFKSLDLIPDGIDDIGYLDDAFVLRVAAKLALATEVGEISEEKMSCLEAIAEQNEVVEAFLGGDEGGLYPRLQTYVEKLRKGAARGWAAADVVGDEEVREEFVSEVRGFAASYEAPSFTREEKNLIKLRAFFDAKLPR